MRHFFRIVLLTPLFLTDQLQAQPIRFAVELAPFSSGINDEFSPVFYNGGIVFCSNQKVNSIVAYTDGENRLFKIYYVTKRDSSKWESPRILAKEITSDFHDGPVTFSETGNTIYYSRNNAIEKSLRNVADSTNMLGLYSAECVNGMWTNIKPFLHGNPLYTFTTPALTPDGERIYFASDMPGGSGGTDLYYCDRSSNGWNPPVSLGAVVNTPKNESFPFACRYGKLFFASDGHKGFGGKDLFYTQEINGEWIAPVHLDSAINSTADDFGLVTDSTLEHGYFSSNRRKTDDIFSFTRAPVEFTSCDSVRENNFCFTFIDEQNQRIDTMPVIYRWDFGNGIIRIGEEVKHCFPGPGEYSVKLSIVDSLTGKAIAEQVEYPVALENIEQAYINSYSVGKVDKPISFEGVTANLKNFKSTDYLWDFGDGFKPGGPSMTRAFKKEGDYTVKLGLLAEADSLGIVPKTCVMKNIRISDAYHEFALKGEPENNAVAESADSVLEQNKSIQIRTYFMNDLSGRQKARIKEAYNESEQLTIKITSYGISPASYPLLDGIGAILRANSDIRLEVILHAFGEEMPGNSMPQSERWAQELAFYFKNRGIDRDVVRSKGYGKSYPTFEPVIPNTKPSDGVVEFIFRSN